MRSLIVDTATKNLYIALMDDENIIEESIFSESKEHSKNIMPQIDRILKDNHLAIKDIDRIYVGIGPGSYTGVRIGVAVCKMLAWTLNIPLYEVSSLYVMSSKFENKAPIIDARRGNVFCASYKNDELEVIEALRNIDEFKAMTSYDLVDEDHFSPDPVKIMRLGKLVNPHACVPNYLRDTEAERTLHGEK